MVDKKSKTIPVRVDLATDMRVKRAARRLRTSSASVIRLAIAAQISAIEAGSIRVPIDLEGGR